MADATPTDQQLAAEVRAAAKALAATIERAAEFDLQVEVSFETRTLCLEAMDDGSSRIRFKSRTAADVRISRSL